MNTLDTMKQALEALEAHADIGIKSDKAITSLRQAIATTEESSATQEPVAIALNTGTKQGVKWLKNVEHGEKLYTHLVHTAQPKREPLTNEEMTKCIVEICNTDDGTGDTRDLIRAVEDKLKEKNT